jgi:hypothetical protein
VSRTTTPEAKYTGNEHHKSEVMASRSNADQTIPVDDYEHVGTQRTDNPPAGLAHLDRDATPVRTLTYGPHLDPQLLSAS